MKQPKMKLELRVSKHMDARSRRFRKEHEYIRLAAVARKFYDSKDWKEIYIRIPNTSQRLLVKPALKADIKGTRKSALKTTGFVTTSTYNMVMKELNSTSNSIWITDTPEELTIGADPEFVFVNEEGVSLYGDNVINESGMDKWGDFGSDGPCGELRPSPSTDAGTLTKNIAKCFSKARGRALEVTWAGGATYWHPNATRTYPIGGHIHIGTPRLSGAHEHALHHVIVRLLDEMVALPLVQIDAPNAAFRRTQANYGRCGSCRVGPEKLEWRTPSGIWLVKRELASSVLAAAKAVAEAAWMEYADHRCSSDYMTSRKFLPFTRKMDDDTLRQIINHSDRTKVGVDLVHDISNRFKRLPTYAKYREQIRYFIKACMGKSPGERTLKNLKKEWL